MNTADFVGYYVFGIIVGIVGWALSLLIVFYVIKWAVLAALRKYESTSPRFDHLYGDAEDDDPMSDD